MRIFVFVVATSISLQPTHKLSRINKTEPIHHKKNEFLSKSLFIIFNCWLFLDSTGRRRMTKCSLHCIKALHGQINTMTRSCFCCCCLLCTYMSTSFIILYSLLNIRKINYTMHSAILLRQL